MARDYEDVHDIDSLPDDDVRALVVQKLTEGENYDADRVTVRVDAGHVYLEGRVGTEQELQVIEHMVSDLVGAGVTNELVVDPLARGERSAAADDAAAEAAQASPPLGDGGQRTSDTAEHLLDGGDRELYGTSDATEAIERGFSYNPPTGPIQEGTRSDEAH
jgi:hypothetical protein